MRRNIVIPNLGIVSLTSIDDAGELVSHAHASHGADGSTGDLSADGTPDDDVVDDLGKVIGVMYQEGEPLRVGRKERERDEHRWELDPASADDYGRRPTPDAGLAETIRKMGHKDRYR